VRLILKRLHKIYICAYIGTYKTVYIFALVAWSRGNVSACGIMDRESATLRSRAQLIRLQIL
jgi:hypothetical protein